MRATVENMDRAKEGKVHVGYAGKSERRNNININIIGPRFLPTSLDLISFLSSQRPPFETPFGLKPFGLFKREKKILST